LLPGTSQIRLHPDSVVASLGEDPDTIPQLKRDYEKRVGRADANFGLEPAPLRHIYVLDWGDTIEIERLKAKNAFIQILTHSYAQRFLKEVAATKRYFRQVEALVPALDQTRTVGLVTLPGAFVGMLLGGATPVQAGAVQVLVLLLLLAVETVAVAVVLELVCRGRILRPGVTAAA
jgi:hypothetical protein